MINRQKKDIIERIKTIIHEANGSFISLIKRLRKFVIWLLWDFSGIRYIWQKIRPPFNKSTGKRQPATFLLWVMSIYLILFGVVSQRYENNVDNIIENRANAILVQLSAPVDTPQFKNAISRIPAVQNTLGPTEPSILQPFSVLHSLYKKNRHEGTVQMLKETIVNFRYNLNDVSLGDIDLQGTNLIGANFQNAYLEYANFQDAFLMDVDYRSAYLGHANFQCAVLNSANFQDAFLMDADFRDEGCTWPYTPNTSITIEQLSKASSLYNIKLNSKLMKQIEAKYPELLKQQTIYGERKNNILHFSTEIPSSMMEYLQ